MLSTLKSGIAVLAGTNILVGTFVKTNKRTGGNKQTGGNFYQIKDPTSILQNLSFQILNNHS